MPHEEAFGIRQRTELKIAVVGNHAEISLAASPSRSSGQAGGRMVYTGALPPEWDSGETITRMRAMRATR